MILKLKTINLTTTKVLFLYEDVDTEKALVSNKISSGEKTINTLLVTCMMIIKLNYYK